MCFLSLSHHSFCVCDGDITDEKMYLKKKKTEKKTEKKESTIPTINQGEKKINKLMKVPPRFELGSLDSESRVLTITPWNHTL